jgi:hypothetical protein
MVTKNLQKISGKFYCEPCEYRCSKQSEYNKHLLTAKHQKITNGNKKSPKNLHCICKFCNKTFKYRSGLSRHNKKCNDDNQIVENKLTTSQEISKSDIIELLKQNQEFKELLTEQQQEIQGLHKQLIDNVKHSGNNIENQTINNNQKFNLNFFLNEQCKDAINMSEFIENMELDLTDLTETSRLGYVGGISRILINKLQELDIYKRPLHCTDMKRETLYIKNNDEWSKENNSKEALNGLVNKASNKNCRNIKQWTDEHPGYQVFDSPENMDYVRLTQAVLGGLGEQECKQFKDKIVRNVIKEVMVNKF